MITDDDARDNKAILPSSSAHLVISNDDLLIHILLRLPIISLVAFKFVSKRWLSLIADPSFTLRRRRIIKIDPPSGLFIQRKNGYFNYTSLLDNKIPLKILDKKILDSCNGLLLCHIPNKRKDAADYDYKDVRIYYVYNPTTNEFKMLPKVRLIVWGVKLAFDPIESPHYKVIVAILKRNPYSIQIQIYSSETCNWTLYGCQFDTRFFIDFKYGVYWNDAIHWINKDHLYYKLDLTHLYLTTKEIPYKFHEGRVYESRGCLLFVCIVKDMYSPKECKLVVSKMNRYSDEWSLMYRLNLDDVVMLIPRPLKINVKKLNFKAIVMRQREEDLFLIMELSGKVLQYSFVLKTVCHLFDITPIDREKKPRTRVGRLFPYYDEPDYIKPSKEIGGFFPYIASFAGV